MVRTRVCGTCDTGSIPVARPNRQKAGFYPVFLFCSLKIKKQKPI